MSKDAGPLHLAAAGGSSLVNDLVAGELDLARLEPAPASVADATAVLDAGADPNERVGAAGLTPLMIATCFGQHAVAELLVARGADPGLRDTLGRTAERFAVFPLIGRVIRLCRRLDMVNAAYVAQVHAPVTHQFTSPAVGLELTAPLPADAFADWPADMPLVAFGLGEDAMSRLVRLMPPVHARSIEGGPRGPFSRTFTLRFADKHPVPEYRFDLEKRFELVLPVDPSTRAPLVYRGRRFFSGVAFDVALVFEAVEGPKRTYALHVTASSSAGARAAADFADTVKAVEESWRKGLAIHDVAPTVRGERYAEEVRDALEVEAKADAVRREDLKKVDALKAEFLAAMQQGRTLSSWNKDGGTEWRWADGKGVMEESDHVQTYQHDEFPDPEAFLAAIRRAYDWDIGRATYPHPPLESAAWEYLIKRLRS